jgi:hypothetical protein
MGRKNPCHTCPGGVDCADCISSPENSVPVKLYTPKGAARAMLVGKILKGEGGRVCYFDEDGFFFDVSGEGDHRKPLSDFSGLWEEPGLL